MFAIYQPTRSLFPSLPTFQTPRCFSPLTARDPNARPLLTADKNSFVHKMSDASHPCKSGSRENPNSNNPRPTHVRGSKFATLTKDPAVERERRRKDYLDKIKAARDGKRFETRAEQGLRRQWLEERRAWWDEREREGEVYLDKDQEEEPVTEDFDAMDELEMLEMEEQMLDALAQEAEEAMEREQEMTDYGSEDEDYEKLMMNIAMQMESEAEPTFASTNESNQEMDLS